MTPPEWTGRALANRETSDMNRVRPRPWIEVKGEFMSFTRFAIYYVPPKDALADFGAAWLGWDSERGRACPQLDVPGLDRITAKPRKYGFHGTLKPPFRLAEGIQATELADACAQMAGSCAPASCDGLELTQMGRFLALTIQGDASGVARVASHCVRELDRFRAPASDAELARRRKARLSDRQDALLNRWGYPYVMEEFRFHMTLTGRVPEDQLNFWIDTLRAHLPPLPAPFVLDQVALVGETSDGQFELIKRYSLTR